MLNCSCIVAIPARVGVYFIIKRDESFYYYYYLSGLRSSLENYSQEPTPHQGASFQQSIVDFFVFYI
jgi:hypothetical protein